MTQEVDELHRQVLNKTVYAFGVPLAMVISATITLVRTHGNSGAWGAWIVIVAGAVVLRVLIMRSVRRDLARLRAHYSP